MLDEICLLDYHLGVVKFAYCSLQGFQEQHTVVKHTTDIWKSVNVSAQVIQLSTENLFAKINTSLYKSAVHYQFTCDLGSKYSPVLES